MRSPDGSEGDAGVGTTEDGHLLVAVAVVWLAIAVLYRVLPMVDMPPGERVWTASAALFLAFAVAVLAVERRATR